MSFGWEGVGQMGPVGDVDVRRRGLSGSRKTRVKRCRGGERASAMWLMDCRCRTWSMLVVGSPFGGEILVRSRCLVGLSMVYTC